MARRTQKGPYLVQVLNEFAEGGWATHQSFKSKKKAIEMSDTIAKSGEYARVRWVDPTDGELVPVHVSDPNESGFLYRHR